MEQLKSATRLNVVFSPALAIALNKIEIRNPKTVNIAENEQEREALYM